MKSQLCQRPNAVGAPDRLSSGSTALAALDWTGELPSLRDLDAAARTVLLKAAVRITIPQGKIVFRPGDACGHFPLIVSGSIRVQRVTESGRVILLYRVTANETCILTIAGLLASDSYQAEAVTETEVTAYILPAAPFKELMNQSAAFRGLVFEGYSRRITMLMSKIEEILCTRVDVRLAERIIALRRESRHIETTQSELAADLGTAREVVGRALHMFERSGWVKLYRGAIEVTDPAALLNFMSSKRD
ncbi:MAG TPA: Crp/Fnr family transcriptional regulator [Methylocella sp.]|nr:Crp/Fnr family transcriptional regulator [Methylocella sp.]